MTPHVNSKATCGFAVDKICPTNTVIYGPVCGVDVNADLQYKIRTLDTVTSNCTVTIYATTNHNDKRRKFKGVIHDRSIVCL